jgi:predicted transcriptional regulator
VLVNLVDKKHITRRLQGKAFYYSAAAPKASLLQEMMRTLARVFAGGSHKELVAQLVETGDLKPADLRFIREVATGTRKPNRKSK